MRPADDADRGSLAGVVHVAVDHHPGIGVIGEVAIDRSAQPLVCKTSLQTRECYRPDCKFPHIKDTKRLTQKYSHGSESIDQQQTQGTAYPRIVPDVSRGEKSIGLLDSRTSTPKHQQEIPGTSDGTLFASMLERLLDKESTLRIC